ncbi:GAK system CofD-like protein [Desulfovibrio ferrophilus]|uniref:GAK system CofD-like protein n=1 Tax=Desulfovibrio ferrophilus TaxID=241368 RepID=UPI0026AD4F43
MVRIRISKDVHLPDPLRLERMARSPELGPKVLFFSGGTALRELSREMLRWSHNTIHIITPFDSGGSSAKLRKAFRMPAVGDIRNRLMALADRSLLGNEEIFRLFAHRLPKEASSGELQDELERMTKGNHRLVSCIPDPMRKIIRHHLQSFQDSMPSDFDLTGASIGNLVLAAGYLEHQRRMDPVIYIFSKLVQARGTVRPVVNKDMHLMAELDNGEVIIGQHLITGKETGPIHETIRSLRLTQTLEGRTVVDVPIRNKMKELIAEAELICYPIGSFYSSVVANLLPSGVGSAIAANSCSKVFVPNLGMDPEAKGLSVTDQIGILLGYLRRDAPNEIADAEILNFVLLDIKNGKYPGPIDQKLIRSWGLEIIDCSLVTEASSPYLDGAKLAEVLLSLT